MHEGRRFAVPDHGVIGDLRVHGPLPPLATMPGS